MRNSTAFAGARERIERAGAGGSRQVLRRDWRVGGLGAFSRGSRQAGRPRGSHTRDAFWVRGVARFAL